MHKVGHEGFRISVEDVANCVPDSLYMFLRFYLVVKKF